MLDYQVCIFINCPLDLFQVIGLNVDTLSVYKLSSVPIILGHSAISFDVNVYWFMFSTIEKERKTEKSEYFRHIISYLYITDVAKIGIVFDTYKYLKGKIRSSFTVHRSSLTSSKLLRSFCA